MAAVALCRSVAAVSNTGETFYPLAIEAGGAVDDWAADPLWRLRWSAHASPPSAGAAKAFGFLVIEREKNRKVPPLWFIAEPVLVGN